MPHETWPAFLAARTWRSWQSSLALWPRQAVSADCARLTVDTGTPLLTYFALLAAISWRAGHTFAAALTSRTALTWRADATNQTALAAISWRAWQALLAALAGHTLFAGRADATNQTAFA